MWSLLARRTQVIILVVLTTVLLLGLQAASEWWTGATPSLLKFISLVATLISTVAVLAANWTWRAIWRKLPFLNRVFFPDLNGVWEGWLQTTWEDPETKQVPGPIPSRVTIRQGVLAINVRQKTGESASWSTRVIPEADPDADRYRLWYSYSNKPNAAVSHRSCDHDGIAWLELSLGDSPDELRGQYFTSRRTTGDIMLRRVSTQP
jgi:hypothetical protein